MNKSLTILCVLAVAGAAQADDWNTRVRNAKQQNQTQTTTVSKPVMTNNVRSFHQNATLHSNATIHPTGVQNYSAARNWQKTQLNTTSSVNTTPRFNRFNKTQALKANTSVNTANSTRWQRFNSTNNTQVTNNTNVTLNNNNRFRRFNIANTNPNAPRIQFRAGNRIAGASNWNGTQYAAFRNYCATWHDRPWWERHHSRIIFVLGGWYCWDAGWWYPAYGYDPYATYYWDGPIYAYNDLPPDQVVANVQSSLQAQGYYHGDIDGIMGPLTRAAIASYQEDHGLLVTSAIDQPTMYSLGFS